MSQERATAIVDAWADEWTIVDSHTTAFKVGAYEALVAAVAIACEEGRRAGWMEAAAQVENTDPDIADFIRARAIADWKALADKEPT